MSPRWGFKTFGFPVRYKHVAPLGLKTGNSCPLYIWALRWGFFCLNHGFTGFNGGHGLKNETPPHRDQR